MHDNLWLHAPLYVPGLPDRPTADVRCHLWAVESCSPENHLYLLELPDQFFVRRLTWKCANDGALRSVVSGCETTFDYAQGKAIVDELRSLTFSPLATCDTMVRTDGKLFCLEAGHFSCNVRFSWCESGPEEWEPLHGWFFDTGSALNQAFGLRFP